MKLQSDPTVKPLHRRTDQRLDGIAPAAQRVVDVVQGGLGHAAFNDGLGVLEQLGLYQFVDQLC